MNSQAGRQFAKQFQFPGGGRGLFGGISALVGLGAVSYGVNASLYNGKCNDPMVFSISTKKPPSIHAPLWNNDGMNMIPWLLLSTQSTVVIVL